jgi:hypothetical protein
MIFDEPHSYDLKKGTSGKAIKDWVVVYARRDTLTAALAKQATYSRYTGKPDGPGGVVRVGGPGWGAVLGHDGRVWLAGPDFPATSVEAVDPATRKAPDRQQRQQ